MSAEPNLPSEMWGALLRIEGATARTEGKVDALALTVSGLTTRVDATDLVVHNIRSKLDQIEGERSQMVPEFKTLLTRVDTLEDERSAQRGVATAIKFVFGGQLVTILAAVFSFYHAMTSAPLPAEHSKTTIESTVSARPSAE